MTPVITAYSEDLLHTTSSLASATEERGGWRGWVERSAAAEGGGFIDPLFLSALRTGSEVRGHRAGGEQGGKKEGEGWRAMRKVCLVSVCPSDEHASLAPRGYRSTSRLTAYSGQRGCAHARVCVCVCVCVCERNIGCSNYLTVQFSLLLMSPLPCQHPYINFHSCQRQTEFPNWEKFHQICYHFSVEMFISPPPALLLW